MTDAHEGANSGEDEATRTRKSKRWAWARRLRTNVRVRVSIGIVYMAALCATLLSAALDDPSLNHPLLIAVYCCAAIATMSYNAYRVFWVKRLPSRWHSDDPRVTLAALSTLLYTGLLLLAAVLTCIARNKHDADQILWAYSVLFAFEWCFSGYLSDRMPLPPTLPAPDPTQPEAPMKPIHSDHWGKRETP